MGTPSQKFIFDIHFYLHQGKYTAQSCRVNESYPPIFYLQLHDPVWNPTEHVLHQDDGLVDAGQSGLHLHGSYPLCPHQQAGELTQ